MKKYYLIILLFHLATFSFAQENKSSVLNSIEIQELSIFPNPVEEGKVFITSKHNQSKIVEIYDVLGKMIFRTKLQNKALDVSRFTSGIYILKIKENNATATRKLIIK